MFRSSLYWIGAVWTLLRKRRKFVNQTTQTDCGVASALSLLNLLGLESDPVHAVETMDPDRIGTNLEALRLYFEEHYGMISTALSVPAARIGEVKGRVILHMRQMHYVVLLKASKAGVLVFDPSLGPVHYALADFEVLFSGYVLQVKRPGRKQRAAFVPPTELKGPPPRAAVRSVSQPVSLFIIGVAMRLMECALLLCLVSVLFLVLNQASFPSLLASFALIVGAGLLLMLTRQIRFEYEDRWARGKQSHLFRSILRTSLRGRDLHGFRGQPESEVASSVRKGLAITIPRRAQVPATLGAFAIMPLMLCLLSPVLGAMHVLYYLLVLIVAQIDNIQVCRRSVKGKIGRYSKLTQGRDLINAAAAPELIGEVAKWTVIGVAGYSVLTGTLPAVALMFWILTAMQIVPLDFKRATMMIPEFGTNDPVSELTASEVELRRQKVFGPVDLDIRHEHNKIQIEGISPLTVALKQPDLTAREQRLIMADVISHTIQNLPEEHRVAIGPIRIFGPGQGALQAEFEHLMITRESRPKGNLPKLRDNRKTVEQTHSDPVLRNLSSCEPGDFPVFWDVRSRLPIDDLESRAHTANCGLVGHLTLDRLTLIAKAG